MPRPFVHLHLHTQYSLLDGAIKHAPLFEHAKASGMPAVAQTDHGNLFGTIEFYQKALAAGVKPIIGCEVYLAGGSRFDREKRERDDNGFDAINHLLLLAMNDTGYRNLMYLVSKAYLEGFYYRPRIDMDLLRRHHEGLICTSGCLSSPVPRAIGYGEMKRAWEVAEDFGQLFGDRYYLELQRHGIPAQDRLNAELVKMSGDLHIPLVATNDAHYLEEEDHGHHDALLCIGTASNLDEAKRLRFDGQGFYVKDGDEMAELFHDHPSAVENTLVIAERCDLEIPLGEYHMPEFQVPAGTTREQVMSEQAWAGLRQRFGMEPDEPFGAQHKVYVERMEHELDVINSMGYAGYFLIVADFIQYARRNRIPVGPGRGSSAGSLVAFGMEITGIDPIKYDILFERFLNPERVSMPDIDVDFCMRGRDQVIRYVADKYGGDEGEESMRVAQIVTFGTLQAKAVIRDVGRVLGMPFGEVDRLAKLVPDTLGITLDEVLEQSPELRTLIQADGQIAQLIETARKLEGLTRHASKHAAGVVIGTEPLIELVPLYKDPRTGDILAQYDWRCVEALGLIKFDFLGLKTLTVISDAEAMIRAGGHLDFDIDKIPLDDEKTFDMLCRGDTDGVFQVESSGMTELMIKFKPRVFTEIIPFVALYRPGPLGSGMVDDFVNRKNGVTKVEYLLPELEEITAETLGVIVYQDQVMQIAQKLAGYTLGGADILRRAMGKKDPSEMAKQRDVFVEGAVERGIDRKKAGEVFDLIAEFSGYGFPKAHSTAYALICYQTAYLKANFTHEYMASLLTIDSANHDRLARRIAHVRERGIEILPPDVNESLQGFSVVPGTRDRAIRFGFAGIKNVGEGAIETILAARASGQSDQSDQSGQAGFEDVFDFCARLDGRKVNRRVVEALVKCGSFDSLHPNRSGVWSSLDAALERGAAEQRDREIGQASLFGASTEPAATRPRLAEAPPWSEQERLGFEKELLGFYVTGHPLGAVATELARFVNTTAMTAAEKDGREVRVGGLITQLRETRTRRGKRMAFLELEDLEGVFELVVFPETYEQYGPLIREAKEGGLDQRPIPLLVSGTLEVGDSPKLLARDFVRLDEAEEKLSMQLRVRVLEPDVSPDRMQALKRVLRAHPGDCAVFLHITIPGESETILTVGGRRGVQPSDALRQDVDALFGRPVSECSQ